MTIAVIILFAVLLGLIAFKLAVTDINAAVFTAQPSGDLPADMAKSVLLDNEYRLNEGQLNSYIAYLIDGSVPEQLPEGKLCVTDVYFDFKENGVNRCYIRTKRDDLVFSFAADCAVALENGEIVMRFSNASVGKLPIADSMLCPVLSRANLGVFNSFICTDNSVPEARLPTHYGLEAGDLGELVSVDIESLTITGDTAVLTTNPVISDALGNAVDIFKDKLGEIAGGLLSGLEDGSISEYGNYIN